MKIDFPEIDFKVECLLNEGYEECGLTFYQTEKEFNCIEEIIAGEMLFPNIKENKLETSSNGLRPGKPELRKPRPEEIPN